MTEQEFYRRLESLDKESQEIILDVIGILREGEDWKREKLRRTVDIDRKVVWLKRKKIDYQEVLDRNGVLTALVIKGRRS